MERVLKDTLPNGFGYEWTDLTFQQKSAGNTALLVFPICVMLVFLILSAQYESWALPLAVILIVPMCLLSAMIGVWLKGSDNNVLTQIGFIVLVGLACKNAILIVEFARERVEHGLTPVAAAVELGGALTILFAIPRARGGAERRPESVTSFGPRRRPISF